MLVQHPQRSRSCLIIQWCSYCRDRHPRTCVQMLQQLSLTVLLWCCCCGCVDPQAERWGAELHTEDVDSIDLSARPFTITSSERTVKAHSVIIATGATAKRLGIPSEEKVGHCSWLHTVLGSTQAALHAVPICVCCSLVSGNDGLLMSMSILCEGVSLTLLPAGFPCAPPGCLCPVEWPTT